MDNCSSAATSTCLHKKLFISDSGLSSKNKVQKYIIKYCDFIEQGMSPETRRGLSLPSLVA